MVTTLSSEEVDGTGIEVVVGGVGTLSVAMVLGAGFGDTIVAGVLSVALLVGTGFGRIKVGGTLSVDTVATF